jgi:hypothetical protein
VFDISDPSNPIQVCNYDTYSPSSYNSYKGAWGVYPYLPSGNIIVSDMQSGLYVLDCTVPVNSVKNINQNLNIYPNPAKDYFNVNKDAKRIEIYDISGRKITQKIIEIEHKFYREDIVNGLYIYRLFNKRDLEIENGKIIFE